MTNKVSASATTQPTTHNLSSEGSKANKYGVSAFQMESTLKKELVARVQQERRKSNPATINDQVASFEALASTFLEGHDAEMLSSKNST